ncbi:MAG TPA: CRTAC1 family protein [Acidobacteriota bacterium]|jgi:hypothetical protein|nr:CRTAC1 family protein [Acidobacteriota bacterium]
MASNKFGTAFLLLGALVPWWFFSGQPTKAPVTHFRNIAAEAGLLHSFANGGVETKKYIIETTGSGVAFFDYNNDGLLDIFVVSGASSDSTTPQDAKSVSTNRLYRNDGTGHFTDVTEEAGLTHSGWGQGVCAGDYDNDGFVDLFITYWGSNVLYRNVNGRYFQDVTARAQLTQDRVRYNSGCAFLDYDGDGYLDLFVANYVKFDFTSAPKPGENPYCWYRNLPVNCGPRGLQSGPNILYHNNGDGTFADVSDASGISGPAQNYSLGALTGDFNNDGRVDIYVACDQTPSILYINQGSGKFSDEALLRGAALDENGKPLSGMGLAAADYDGNGWLDIFRTNFSDERETLYRNRGDGNFDDATVSAGLAHNTRFVGWGCGFFDFDNDGWKDLLLVNGHVYPEVDRLNIDIHCKERAILYRNLGNGKFTDISELAGPALKERHAARGAAFGDIDNDGNIEVLVNHQNELPGLLRQSRRTENNWIILKLIGVKSNRSAIGARVRLTAGNRTQTDEVRSGGSYLSQNDLRLHFGLGKAARVQRIEIDWPSGIHQTEYDLPVNQVMAVRESAESR